MKYLSRILCKIKKYQQMSNGLFRPRSKIFYGPILKQFGSIILFSELNLFTKEAVYLIFWGNKALNIGSYILAHTGSSWLHDPYILPKTFPSPVWFSHRSPSPKVQIYQNFACTILLDSEKYHFSPSHSILLLKAYPAMF